MLIVVPVNSPIKTYQDLVKLAKEQGDRLSFAGSGLNSANHAAHERMNAAFNFKTTYVPFKGTGLIRIVYFAVLIPHVILAAVILPLQFITLARGLKMDRTRHRKIARITLPLWLYVSVTGVIVYLMLY